MTYKISEVLRKLKEENPLTPSPYLVLFSDFSGHFEWRGRELPGSIFNNREMLAKVCRKIMGCCEEKDKVLFE